MNTTALKVVQGGQPAALARVVATARKMEEHDEVDRWEFADDVAEAIDALSDDQNGFGHGEPHIKTGLYRAIDEVNDQIAKAGVVSVGRQSIVGAYTTAKSWPTEERVEGANYWAHFELRGRDYDGRRRRVLERLVRTSKTRVSTPQVRLWKSAQVSGPVVPFLEKVERRLTSALRGAGNPWDKVGDEDRKQIAAILRQLAAQVGSGDFQ